MSKRVVVIGAGGHGRSVAEAILLLGRDELVGFVDDGAAPDSRIWGYPVLGTTGSLSAHRGIADAVLVAIGNNAVGARFAGFREVWPRFHGAPAPLSQHA